MRVTRTRSIVAVGAIAAGAWLLAACGADGGNDEAQSDKSTTTEAESTTTTTEAETTTTAAPTTTSAPLAAGETETLAEIANDPPDGYRFIDAPASVVEELSATLTADPEAAEAIVGSSVHSVVSDTDDASIGLLMLVEIAPEYAALPNFAEGLAQGFGEGGQSKQIDNTTWTLYEDAEGTLTYLTFGRLDNESGVMVIVIGDDAASLETFLAA
jgi:hypothetical protein